MVNLTIYTATFNRMNLLTRLYESLKNQTVFDFIWLIIDDGSMDSTAEVVTRWMQEDSLFEIRYYYKKNEGIHSARNVAHHEADTELLVSVDSDDYLKPEAVETILLIWSQRKKISDDYAGIVSPCVSMEGNRITKNFPRNIISASLQELSYHYRCKGDKWIVVRTEILKQLKVAPIFSGEKLVGESYFWYQISPYLNFMLCEKELCVVDYQRNGYSANAYKSMFENPHGCQVEYLIIRNNATYTAARLKGMIGFISSSILIHDYKFVEKAPNKIEALLMLPFGLCWLIFLSLRKQILDRRGLELTRTSSNCN